MAIVLSLNKMTGRFEAILVMDDGLAFWARGKNLTQLETRLLRIARLRGARLPLDLP
jgi:predicted small integral membrane protein